MPLIAQNLKKTYAGRPVVNGVSFTVHPGEVVGLLGPNGAGKTTSFYAVVGMIELDKGCPPESVILDDTPLGGMPIHARARLGLGYLPQEPSVFRKLSVLENLLLVLEFQKRSKASRLTRANELLEEFGLTKLRDTPAIQLSGGERRRVEIARALAANPRYLMLDEPFTGIDPLAIEDLQTLIRQLRERGLGILLTDHNPRATLAIVDRVNIVYEGRVIFAGTTAEAQASSLVRESYLGEALV
ncbi:MAG: LPS export ABC transporter ATP-binding protein [Vampirovibrionales bacterium]|nr:LPS export ABC transporter ATP-binding protein [Vampirovibrionales bacterium]